LQRLADNFGTTAWAFNKLLNVVNVAHSVLGATPLKAISSALNKMTGHVVPEWNPYMPKVGGWAGFNRSSSLCAACQPHGVPAADESCTSPGTSSSMACLFC
jgi:D-lactate dehydrogenase